MADLSEVLPDFDLKPWKHLTYSLEKKSVTTAELIALDPLEIARKCPLPLKEVRRMATAVSLALRDDLRPIQRLENLSTTEVAENEPPRKKVRYASSSATTAIAPRYVKTLDEQIDLCLGGGFPAGCITEIVGESAVGKTQFVLSLLLAAQTPSPQGLGQKVIYISTEGGLNTARLLQMVKAHPVYQALPLSDQPNLDAILTIEAPTFEIQESIIEYQLPEAVRRYKPGLVVLDSVTANFRVAFQGAARKVLGERAVALIKLGRALRKVAHENGIAVVVVNQVSDRFDDEKALHDKVIWAQSQTQSSQVNGKKNDAPTRQIATNGASPAKFVNSSQMNGRAHLATSQQTRQNEILSLDFQQRFFTGWGGDAGVSPFATLKTPALGLTWTNQLDARIVLKFFQQATHGTSETGNIWSNVKRKRHLRVVFASWVKPSAQGIEYELEMQGPVSVPSKNGKQLQEDEDFDADHDWSTVDDLDAHEEHTELLDPRYWEAGDDEFP